MRLKILILLAWFVVSSCDREINIPDDCVNNGVEALIFPDYDGTTLPINIAPPNFMMMRRCKLFVAEFIVGGKVVKSLKGSQYLDIKSEKWEDIKREALKHDGIVTLSIACDAGKRWGRYNPISFTISKDSIDPYVVYRLIYPGYENWSSMGIYQRCLENFKETAIVENSTDKNCVNCHSFCNYSADKFMFHSRGSLAGTLIVDGDTETFLKGKSSLSQDGLSYPRWHPSGKYIAFASGATRQFFHSSMPKKVEVYDLRSDIVLYDVAQNKVLRDTTHTARLDAFETFPVWSPSGDRLYFCRADSMTMPDSYENMRYMICSVAFDGDSGCFSGSVDTVLYIKDKSLVFPRISNNGRFLLLSCMDYGCFAAWHPESDLLVWDLKEQREVEHNANSNDAETYHSWSSNDKWVVFGSRRLDGLFTRLWFSHVSDDGCLSKPFLLPQCGNSLIDDRLFSYNVPEFVKSPIAVSKGKILRSIRSEAKPIQNH